jgi:hypothetical protein
LELVGGLRENPGVYGKQYGSGVIILEVCARCGARRTTDTGEHEVVVQPLREWTLYEEDRERVREWLREHSVEDDECWYA